MSKVPDVGFLPIESNFVCNLLEKGMLIRSHKS